MYGDEDDYIANYEDAKPSTTEQLLAERDVLYGKGKVSKFISWRFEQNSQALSAFCKWMLIC